MYSKGTEWLGAETKSKAKERLGEARPGHREELKELSCEGKERHSEEWQRSSEERQWNSVDLRCVAMD